MLAAETVANTVASRIGGNAFTSHPHPFAEDELPAWRVEYQVEPTENASLDGINQHVLSIKAKGYARAVDDLESALNTLASAAMSAVFASPVPYGLSLEGEVTRDMANEGQAAVGVIELPIQALYFTRPSSPETILSA